MNYNTQRAMVNRAKAAYDEEAKTTAASYSIYSEAKKKYDEMLEEYNRITSNTSSINIEYENAKSSVEKSLMKLMLLKIILNDLRNLIIIQVMC